MCKECRHEPYLASMVVWFMLRHTRLTEVPGEEGRKSFAYVEHCNGPYTGICVSHHRHWVSVRTKSNTYRFRDDSEDLLAYANPNETLEM